MQKYDEKNKIFFMFSDFVENAFVFLSKKNEKWKIKNNVLTLRRSEWKSTQRE